jgi:hypothetical protein
LQIKEYQIVQTSQSIKIHKSYTIENKNILDSITNGTFKNTLTMNFVIVMFDFLSFNYWFLSYFIDKMMIYRVYKPLYIVFVVNEKNRYGVIMRLFQFILYLFINIVSIRLFGCWQILSFIFEIQWLWNFFPFEYFETKNNLISINNTLKGWKLSVVQLEKF